jgi:hypothetical protein
MYLQVKILYLLFISIYFNLFQFISIYFNLFQFISIYFNLFQFISIYFLHGYFENRTSIQETL